MCHGTLDHFPSCALDMPYHWLRSLFNTLPKLWSIQRLYGHFEFKQLWIWTLEAGMHFGWRVDLISTYVKVISRYKMKRKYKKYI